MGARELLLKLKKTLHLGCKTCGDTPEFGDYCIDHWPGYEDCCRPGCNHYHCEHGFGEEVELVYCKDNPEMVGQKFLQPVGCMNAGCECSGFMTKADLMRMVSELGYARSNGSWELSQMPGVEDVRTSVRLYIDVTTTMDTDDPETRKAIYQKELEIMDKYPGVSFDFHVTWNPKQTEGSIKG